MTYQNNSGIENEISFCVSAGLFLFIPWLDVIQKVDLRTVSFTSQPQEVRSMIITHREKTVLYVCFSMIFSLFIPCLGSDCRRGSINGGCCCVLPSGGPLALGDACWKWPHTLWPKRPWMPRWAHTHSDRHTVTEEKHGKENGSEGNEQKRWRKSIWMMLFCKSYFIL